MRIDKFSRGAYFGLNLSSFKPKLTDGKENSFAFMLTEAGFDVYLSNSRGNRYSREHVI